MTLDEWKDSHSKARQYAHFDQRVSLQQVWKYISDPQCVSRHAFFPFIHFTKKTIKYSRYSKEKKYKPREICYSAHVDRYIYQYYSYQINQYYNALLASLGLSHVSIAYRDNLSGNSNIHFAKRAFDFIRETGPCYVFVGDFTKFFDSLDHKYLKEMLKKVLGVSTLPNDYYAVYKSIIWYSVWERSSIYAINGLEDNYRGYCELKKKGRALTPEQFRQHKKENVRQPTKEQGFGIPQGSAISAAFSNIYMLDTDLAVNSYVASRGGLYMRYSDDFMIVFPKAETDIAASVKDILQIMNMVDGLKCQAEKTKVYFFENKTVAEISHDLSIHNERQINRIDYLGFSLDGNAVSIRDKTITKYYYRLYRKARTIVERRGVSPKGKKISGKNLYLKYSIKGAFVDKGNFLTYVERAKEVFRDNQADYEAIDRSTKRHMQKIRKQMNKVSAFEYD